jgi:hypothetical protein
MRLHDPFSLFGSFTECCAVLYTTYFPVIFENYQKRSSVNCHRFNINPKHRVELYSIIYYTLNIQELHLFQHVVKFCYVVMKGPHLQLCPFSPTFHDLRIMSRLWLRWICWKVISWCMLLRCVMYLPQSHRLDTSFEAFTVMMFQVEVFWVVTLCSVVVGHQRFKGQRCLKLDAPWSSETLIFYRNTTRHHNPEDLNLK